MLSPVSWHCDRLQPSKTGRESGSGRFVEPHGASPKCEGLGRMEKRARFCAIACTGCRGGQGYRAPGVAARRPRTSAARDVRLADRDGFKCRIWQP